MEKLVVLIEGAKRTFIHNEKSSALTILNTI